MKLANYILNSIDGEGYGKEFKTEADKITFVLECFKYEYLHINNIAQFNRAPAKVFGEWLGGLPSVINIDFYNHIILDIGYLFGFITSEATEEEEDEFLNSWFELIAKTFLQMNTDLHLFNN